MAIKWTQGLSMVSYGFHRMQRDSYRTMRICFQIQGQDEWKFLSTIFYKNETVLEYEAIKLLK